MKFEINSKIKLKSFLGTINSKKQVAKKDNYWKLIGKKGKIIDIDENNSDRFLVLFDKNLNDFEIENHNPIKNSLWIKKLDLEFCEN
jgi:hypothetical protein